MKSCFVMKTDEVPICDDTSFFYIVETRGFYAERKKMELRKDFLQIIPSFVLRDLETKSILLYQRKEKHTEQRLAAKWTPVFGGHIDPVDWDKEVFKKNQSISNVSVPPIILNGLQREMIEETGLDLQHLLSSVEYGGLIFDSNDEVGLVHLGVLFYVDVCLGVELLNQIWAKSEIGQILQIQNNIDTIDTMLKDDSEHTLEGWARIVLQRLKAHVK